MISASVTKSFKIPASLEIEINKKLVAEGYGLRGKSKWICDAITQFLNCQDKDFILDCIEFSEELKNLNKSISFRPTETVYILLDQWIVAVRMKMPMIEGVKSKIIRTAIIHKLLGSVNSIEKIKQTHSNTSSLAALL